MFHFHRVAKEDEGKTIECVVVSANGSTISNEQIVNPGCKSLIHCSLVVKSPTPLTSVVLKLNTRLLHGLRTSLSKLISLLLVHPASC